MSILVIFTGGTIGSSVVDNYASPHKSNNYALINNYLSRNPLAKAMDFVSLDAFSILSENLSFKVLNTLIKKVKSNLNKDYEGIIITHGTDTLQYTSSALSFALGNVPVPVVLVSSAYPLTHKSQNGDNNFAAAVEFIKNGDSKGVFVSYQNKPNGPVFIYSGTRVLSHHELSHDILCKDDEWVAYSKDGVIIKNKEYKPCKAEEISFGGFSKSSGILVIDSHPADSFSYSLRGVRAVLFHPYHSGTLNTESKDLAKLCRKARDYGIPLFVVQKKENSAYESVKVFDELGIITLPYMTYPSAYIKLWLGISMGMGEELASFMMSRLSDEI